VYDLNREVPTMPNPRFEFLTKQDVIRAARKVNPKEIQKWSVIVDGNEYPVKQLLMESANMSDSSAPRVTPADFIAHYAVRKLKKLGFTVKYYEKGA
jgi:nucleoside-diphosphate-sugar epimerase